MVWVTLDHEFEYLLDAETPAVTDDLHMFQLTFWSIPPLIAALVCVGAYLRIQHKYDVPGVRAVLMLLVAVMFWSGAQFVGSLFTGIETKIVAAKLAYFGIVMAPVSWFIFAMTYTRKQLKAPRWLLNTVCVVPLITICLVMTNEWHQLVWADTYLTFARGYAGLDTAWGPWFYIHTVYSYVLLVSATAILAFSISEFSHTRKPLLAVIFAPIIVCLANVFYLLPWISFDITTLGFAAAVLILDGGVLRYGLFDNIPVLREWVVEKLSDGVIVVNTQDRVIDINPSGLKMLRTNREALSKHPITEYIRTMPLSDLRSSESKELTLNDRAYDVTSSVLDPTNPESDAVFVFRDVTRRREDERRLKKMQRELERLAHTDALTGLSNRRIFIERLQEETERVVRHGSSLSVLLFDLDHFKKVNDTYGHDVGDHVLQGVADVSIRIKRVTDVAARIGGEEFALLLPETGQEGAVQLAQRLRQAIADQPHLDDHGNEITVTASIGVATVRRSSDQVEHVLKHADQALYRAKNSGRNMVCCTQS